MVFLQAAARPSGPAGALLDSVEDGSLRLLLSREILEEVRDVLCRPELTSKFASLKPDLVQQFLDRLMLRSEIIEGIVRKFTYDRDPKDEKYINLAIAGQADYLISRDNDLLDLEGNQTIQKITAGSKTFRVVDPFTMLELLRQPFTG